MKRVAADESQSITQAPIHVHVEECANAECPHKKYWMGFRAKIDAISKEMTDLIGKIDGAETARLERNAQPLDFDAMDPNVLLFSQCRAFMVHEDIIYVCAARAIENRNVCVGHRKCHHLVRYQDGRIRRDPPPAKAHKPRVSSIEQAAACGHNDCNGMIMCYLALCQERKALRAELAKMEDKNKRREVTGVESRHCQGGACRAHIQCGNGSFRCSERARYGKKHCWLHRDLKPAAPLTPAK